MARCSSAFASSTRPSLKVRFRRGRRQLNGEEKHELAADIAGRIGFDYDALVQQRPYRVMAPEKVELHTHRYPTPVDEKLFVREIDQSRSIIST